MYTASSDQTHGERIEQVFSVTLADKGVCIETMNNPGHAAAGPWCYPDDAGEAAATTASSFADMIADYYFTFKLAWSGSRASGSTTTMQPPAAAQSRSPPPEVRFDPPSEGEMAAWLSAIVNGEGLASNEDGDDRRRRTAGGCRDVQAARKPSDTSTTAAGKEEKLPLTEGMGSIEQEMRKPPAGGSSRRSHHAEAHNLTEKRRRHKIYERLRTLQELVPGCDDKSNQASTLDQTIQYMKSLQHHVQAMSDGPARPPLPPPPAYHIVPPQYVPPPVAPVAVPMPGAPMVLAAAPTTTMVPAMLQLPHYHAPVPVMMAAAAAPLYPAAEPPRWLRSSPSHRHGSSSSSKRNGSSSHRHGHCSRNLRKKH